MAFDPTKFGATPVTTAPAKTGGFDPSVFGATPVAQQKTQQPSGPFKYDVPETHEDKMQRYQMEAATAKQHADEANSFMERWVRPIANSLLPGVASLGDTVGGIINTNTMTDSHEKALQNIDNVQIGLMKKIKELDASGQDSTKFKRLYNQGVDSRQRLIDSYNELTAGAQKSTGKVAGEIGLTALNTLTAGTYGKAVGAMQSGKLALPAFMGGATKTIPAVVENARNLLPKATGIFTKQGLKNVATGVAKALPVGYAYDTAMGFAGMRGEDREGAKALIPGAATAVSGVLGGTVPALTESAQSIKNVYNTRVEKAANELDNLVGKISQGKEADIPKVKQALSNIETTGIKTYRDLRDAISAKIQGIATKLDNVLATDTTARKLDQLSFSTKVGDQTVSHNYVDDALNQLGDYYASTNDVAAKAKIDQIKVKAQNEGLTINDINNIAREHGKALNAFNANGELSSGVSKQAIENTRTGLKNTARNLFGNKIFQEADDEITKLIRTRDLVNDMSEKVNQLKQKIIERGLFEKAGRSIGKIVNLISGSSLKGFVESFIPRGQGFKTMNAIDLERMLQNNLGRVQELLQKDLPEKQIIQKLDELYSDLSNSGRALRGSRDAVRDANLPTNQRTNANGDTTILNANPMRNNKTGTNMIPSAIDKASDMPKRLPLNEGKGKIGVIAGTAATIAGSTIPFIPRKMSYTSPKTETPAISNDNSGDVKNISEAIAYNETRGEKAPYSFRQPSGVKAYGDALGRYQITEAELKTSGKRFIGTAVTPKQFLASPDLQDLYMANKIKFLQSKGYDVSQILASHRGGFSNLDNVATKQKKYKAYVDSGMKKYQELAGNQ